jgi:hypothetical protein
MLNRFEYKKIHFFDAKDALILLFALGYDLFDFVSVILVYDEKQLFELSYPIVVVGW